MLGDVFLWLVANLKQGVIYFIKQALPPNKSAGSVSEPYNFEFLVGPDYRKRKFLDKFYKSENIQ